jgi:hypothetical protein
MTINERISDVYEQLSEVSIELDDPNDMPVVWERTAELNAKLDELYAELEN